MVFGVQGLLGGSGVVISIQGYKPFKYGFTILITLLITTHEPPSRVSSTNVFVQVRAKLREQRTTALQVPKLRNPSGSK